MGDQTLQRASALDGHYTTGHHGLVDAVGVTITQVTDITLWQMAAWPNTIDQTSADLAQHAGVGSVPSMCQASGDHRLALLRIEPLKFWVYGAAVSSKDASESAVLDLSQSRTQLRLSGPKATTVLNGFLPLDLRESSFALNHVASSAFHHVGVTLWRSDAGYELFIPRGFAVSVWELLLQSALQYGVEVR